MNTSELRKTFNKLSSNLVIQNLFIVSTITLITKGIGFYKETIVAANFGLSELLDTFFIAILVPTFISNVFLGAYRSVFVPNYIAELKTNGNRGSFQSSSFLITILVSIVFMIIAYLTTDVFLEKLYPNHEPNFYELVKEQFYILLPCVVFWGLASLLGGLLNIANEYRLSSFANIFTPLTVIVSLIFFKNYFETKVLAIGTLAGAICGFIYLLAIAYSKRIIIIDFPDFKNDNIKMLFKQIPAKVSSGVLSGLNPVIDQFFAAQLIVGSIAALNYGLKIPSFLMGLVTIAISNVLLPYFSKSIHDDKKKTFSTLFKSIKLVFSVISCLAFIGFIVSPDLVALIFERKEFTSADTIVVARIQQIFLIYLPFTISGMIMVNFLTSINKNAIMAYISFVALLLNLLFDYILMEYYGIFGIALSTTIISVLKNIFLFIYIYKLRKSQLTLG